jgi:hypothetical protein
MITGTAIGLVIFAPWTTLPLGPPTGLTAGTWTTTSVTLSWSRPASGPNPGRYIIYQDGRAVGSVPGTATTYRATGLAQDTTHTYQVGSARGSDKIPKSSAIAVRTYLPPAWQAALTGIWTAHYAVVTADPPGFKEPQLTTDTWTFTSKCASGTCRLTVAGALSGSSFTATLQLSGGRYRGRATDKTFLGCGSAPDPTTLTLDIGAASGAIIAGRWDAASWSGSIVLATSVVGHCFATTATATVSASGGPA